MPIFLDLHDASAVSEEDVAKLHIKDLEIQDKYGAKFLTCGATPSAEQHSVL